MRKNVCLSASLAKSGSTLHDNEQYCECQKLCTCMRIYISLVDNRKWVPEKSETPDFVISSVVECLTLFVDDHERLYRQPIKLQPFNLSSLNYTHIF